MAKILISPLGTGPISKNGNLVRQYNKATYKISDGKQYNASFISAVLKEHYQIDHIIFIGTVKSMWEEVYRHYKNLDNSGDDYYWNLAENIESLNHSSPLNSIDLTTLEQTLSERSKCILIKYGLNEDELKENLNIIVPKIQDIIQPGDEVYFDITHSFRSLSVYIFLILMLLRDIKEVKIGKIFYGMLEVQKELGYAPIVDLSYLLKIVELIKAAYEFQKFGSGFLLSELLQSTDQDLAKTIHTLSKAISLNYSQEIIDTSNQLFKQTKNIPSPYSYFVPDVVNSFTKKINTQKTRSHKEYELANWHCEKKNYSSAYILLTECLVTYVCEKENLNPSKKDDRETAKNKILNNDPNYENMQNLFHQISNIRNKVAHNLSRGNSQDLQDAWNKLRNYLTEVHKLLN